MVFFCACVHPDTNNVMLSKDMPPGYWLTEIELCKMAKMAGGIPLTFEHSGITKAVETLVSSGTKLDTKNIRYQLEELSKKNPVNTIIGTITKFWKSASGAWWITIFLDDKFDSIAWLINRSHVRGVSLTHIEDATTNEKIPLEVSLCKIPARPLCFIYRGFRRPFEAIEYMRSMQRGDIADPTSVTMASIPATTTVDPARETPSAPIKVSRIEEVLETLSEENRKLIEDRLITASSNMETAIAQMEETKRLSNITESNLKAQVGVLKAHIDPEILTNCHIDNEQYLKDLYSDNANDVRRTLDRVLIAANMTLMNYKNQMYQSTQKSGSKRVRVDEPAREQKESQLIVASSNAEPTTFSTGENSISTGNSDRENALMRAISDTFDIV